MHIRQNADGADGPIGSGAANAAVRLARILALGAAITASGCGGSEIEKPTPRSTEGAVMYPAVLWQQGVEGTTLVRVLVDEEGAVDSAMVAESSGHQALDSAAVQGVRTIRFEPALQRGRPVRVWVRVPVHFSKGGIGVGSIAGEGADPDARGSADRSSAQGRQ